MTKAMSMLLLHGTNVEATVVQGHLALAFHLEVCKLLEEACTCIYIYIYMYIYIEFCNLYAMYDKLFVKNNF